MRSITLIALLFVSIAFSQKKSKMEWGFFGKKTVAQRNATFPFKDAKKVVLVAYPSPNGVYVDENRDAHPGLSESFKNDPHNYITIVKLPKGAKYYVTESATLPQSEIDKLSNVLLNYTVKTPSDMVEPINCHYEPSNAILFLDKDEKVISYIEIYFECEQFYQFPQTTIPYFDVLCLWDGHEKMVGLIKDIFKNAGIKRGVEEIKFK